MPRFRVKMGTHVEGGVRYVEGEVVDTSLNLIAMFPQKFDKVEGGWEERDAQPAPAEDSQTVPTANPTPVKPAGKPLRKRG